LALIIERQAQYNCISNNRGMSPKHCLAGSQPAKQCPHALCYLYSTGEDTGEVPEIAQNLLR